MDTGNYKHLLLAVDFEPSGAPVIARARQLRTLFGARLSLLHVLEHVTAAQEYLPLGFGGDLPVPDDFGLEEDLLPRLRGTPFELDAESLRSRRLRIPMAGGVSSLNVSAAGAVVLFEAFRQRRNVLRAEGAVGRTAGAAVGLTAGAASKPKKQKGLGS